MGWTGSEECPAGNLSVRSKADLRSGVVAAALLSLCLSNAARADEGGVSFWLPGIYGSLAATPLQPGWSFAAVGYHTSVSASGSPSAITL